MCRLKTALMAYDIDIVYLQAAVIGIHLFTPVQHSGQSQVLVARLKRCKSFSSRPAKPPITNSASPEAEATKPAPPLPCTEPPHLVNFRPLYR